MKRKKRNLVHNQEEGTYNAYGECEKKQKADKLKGAIPLVLTNGDIDEIGDKVQEVTTQT